MIPCCPRVKLAMLGELIPARFRETLEQNQLISSCCRHPEDHDIEAFRSVEAEKAPDIYVLYCKCGRKHIRFMCADGIRPMWEVR
jgi:hypothetical protein